MSARWHPAAALVAILLAAAGARADPPSPAAPTVAHAAHGRADLGASAAFDHRGHLLAVHRWQGRLVLQRSPDLGRTWSPPQPVLAVEEPVAADGDARPRVATGPGDEVYVTWTRPLRRPYTGEVRFARSGDGGARFDPPLTVHTDRQEITHRFDALAVAGGVVHVAWIDKRDQERARREGRPSRGAAIYAAASRDGGRSFGPDFQVAEASCECCRIALLADADGSATALWRHVFEPDVRDHALARWQADGRVEWVRRATFEGWRVDACPHHGPSLARGADGVLHAVWFTLAPEAPGVHYGRLRDGAVEGRTAVGDESAAHADVAAAGRRVAVVWKSFDGERTRLHVMRSDDGGQHWQTQALAATTEASAQPLVLARDGRFHVFWHTRERPLGVWSLP